MKEINIARVLVTKRREKGLTQDELAYHIGVSKASVSKWETGQSYPDVVLLPQLAAFFNISLDELMDYQPQMEKADIRRLYQALCGDFATKPFDEVSECCRQIIKKYYSCFALLLQMGILLINHVELAQSEKQASETVALAKELFTRVREESGEVSLIKQALYMEAGCCLSQGQPNGALALLEGSETLSLPPELLLSAAYSMTGRQREAREVLQGGMYQTLVLLFNFLPAILSMYADDPQRFDETLRRARCVAEAFDLRRLHPAMEISLLLTAANGYMAQGRTQEGLTMLWEYTELVTDSAIYPFVLKGDDYFDLLDEWLERLELGTQLPRSDKTVRQSMLHAVQKNPIFSSLKGNPQFESILKKLEAMDNNL